MASASALTKPNILHILLDDWGWADAEWHRSSGASADLRVSDADLQTPRMRALLRQGIELDRHYAYMFCSPSRSALQSGRNPIHVNTENAAPNVNNPDGVAWPLAASPAWL